MTHWLTIGGGIILFVTAIVLVILWQRVYYECTVRKYATWSVQAAVHWCAGAFLLQARYDSGAGWWWECITPFWRRDAYGEEQARAAATAASDTEEDMTESATPKETNAAAGESGGQPTGNDAPTPEKPSPSWQAYLGLVRYAVRVGLISAVARYIRRVQARMWPRSWDGEARIGLADAYTQGLLMGALYATCPPIAARITFVFTETVAEGRVTVGGGVRPLALCGDTWRLLCEPAVWKTVWYYWRHVRPQ